MKSQPDLLNPKGAGWRPTAGFGGPATANGSSRPLTLPGELEESKSHGYRSNGPLTKEQGKARRAKNGISGRVYGFQARGEKNSLADLTVWTFRVIRYDESENRLPLPPMVVEMKAWAFDGWINENDQVYIAGNWREGQIIVTDRIFNLTTETTVSTRDPWQKAKWINNVLLMMAYATLWCILLVIVAVLLLIVYGILR